MRKMMMCSLSKCSKYSILDINTNELPLVVRCPHCETTMAIHSLPKDLGKVPINTKNIMSYEVVKDKSERMVASLNMEKRIKLFNDFIDKFASFNAYVAEMCMEQDEALSELYEESRKISSLMSNTSINVSESKMKSFLAFPFKMYRVKSNSNNSSFMLMYPSYIKEDIGLVISNDGAFKSSLINGPVIISEAISPQVLSMIKFATPHKVIISGDTAMFSDDRWISYFSDLLSDSSADTEELRCFQIKNKVKLFQELAMLGVQPLSPRESFGLREELIDLKVDNYGASEANMSKLLMMKETAKEVAFFNRFLFVVESTRLLIPIITSCTGLHDSCFIVTDRTEKDMYGAKDSRKSLSIIVNSQNYRKFDSFFLDGMKLAIVDVDHWDGFFYEELLEISDRCDMIFVSSSLLMDFFTENKVCPKVYSLVNRVVKEKGYANDFKDQFIINPVVQ